MLVIHNGNAPPCLHKNAMQGKVRFQNAVHDAGDQGKGSENFENGKE